MVKDISVILGLSLELTGYPVQTHGDFIRLSVKLGILTQVGRTDLFVGLHY